MTYHLSRTVDLPFDKAEERVREELAKEGFGVLTEIDVQATLKKKLGEEFRPYKILGACNPKLAYGALQVEDKVGTMLPCNVILQEKGGKVEVAAIDPVASMQAIENEQLKKTAKDVRERLQRVVEAL